MHVKTKMCGDQVSMSVHSIAERERVHLLAYLNSGVEHEQAQDKC